MTQTFSVEISGEVTLTKEDLWPGGDGPENPTNEDAAKALREMGTRPSKIAMEIGCPMQMTVNGAHVASDPWA